MTVHSCCSYKWQLPQPLTQKHPAAMDDMGVEYNEESPNERHTDEALPMKSSVALTERSPTVP